MGMMISGCTSEEAENHQNAGHENHTQENHTQENHPSEESSAHQHSGNLHELKLSLEENEVLLTEKQMETAGIKLGPITRQSLSQMVKSFGEIVLSPSDEATVSALIGGVTGNIRVMEGDFVKKGQMMARIEHPDIVDMQQNYLEALNRDEYLEAEYKRQKSLLEDSVNSEKTFQQAKNEYRSNEVRLQGLKQKLKLLHISPEQLTTQTIKNAYPVLAPISGYVARVDVNAGSHVTPQQSLFHITANHKAHIDLNIYEKDINRISEGQKLTFKLANNSMDKPMEGKVTKLSKRFDADQRTGLVHADISEMNEKLLPGMSVIAYIQTGDKKQSTLPEAGFVSDQGNDYIFVLKKQGLIDEEHEAHHDGPEPVHEETHQSETEANHSHEADKKEPDTEQTHHEKAGHYFIFERIHINKEITEGHYSGFTHDESFLEDAMFVVNNAQMLMAEMKKGGSGHSGHAH